MAACTTQLYSQGQNLILNGDFENNGATSSQYDMSNSMFDSLIYNATAFGTGDEIDLMTTDSPYGQPPESGLWKLGIHKSGYPIYGNDDAFSFTLSSPLVAGQQYALSFFGQDVVSAQNPGGGQVQVGVSGSPTSFGTLVFAGTLGTNFWTHLTATFATPTNGLYLTVQVDPNAVPTWANIDNFSLTAVPEPGTFALLSSLGLIVFPVRENGSELSERGKLRRAGQAMKVSTVQLARAVSGSLNAHMHWTRDFASVSIEHHWPAPVTQHDPYDHRTQPRHAGGCRARAFVGVLP